MSATETALVLVEQMTPAQIFAPGAIDPILERIKAEVRSVATDISTEKGRKEVASLAYKVARSKTFIDNQRKALVADEKKRLALIDKEGKRIWDELESLQTEVRKPLTDWEDAEKERVAAHELCIAQLIESPNYGQTETSEELKNRIAYLRSYTRDWQEFGQRAAYTINTEIERTERLLTAALKREEEAAELLRLRKEAAEREQKDREERLAREAAEKAKVEAEAKAHEEKERLERQTREAEERARKAEADRIAAEKRVEAEKQAAIERERQRVEAEKKAEADAQAKREANKRHRAKVNNEAAAAFKKIGFDEESAKSIVALIAKGEVPHVVINY